MTRTAQETRARRKSCPGPLPTLLPFSALETCEFTLSITKRVRRTARDSESLRLEFTEKALSALINIKLAALLALRPSITSINDPIYFAGFSHCSLRTTHCEPSGPHQLRAAGLMCALFVQSLHSSTSSCCVRERP
jgi:hypothetical protein